MKAFYLPFLLVLLISSVSCDQKMKCPKGKILIDGKCAIHGISVEPVQESGDENPEQIKE